MKIAILGSRGFPSHYGGYETFVREFAPHCVEREHDVTVYCRWLKDGAPIWDCEGVTCRGVPGVDMQSLSTLTYGAAAARDACRGDYDAVLVLNSANGFFLPVLDRAGFPTVVNTDGLEWERQKWNLLGRTAFRGAAQFVARYASAIVADSRAIGQYWHRKFGVRPTYIPYGGHIIEDDSTDKLDELGIPAGEYVLTVSRLVPENNVELTLDALDLLGAERPPHVVVGSSRRPTDLTRRLADRAQRDDTWWLGHVSDDRLLHQLWRHCRTYAHGHSVGGTNPSLVQALAAGAPTLAYDSEFTRQVIGNVDAYYDDRPESLSDRLLGLGASPEYRETLVENGLTRVREEYSWEAVCDRYLELLASVSGKAFIPSAAPSVPDRV